MTISLPRDQDLLHDRDPREQAETELERRTWALIDHMHDMLVVTYLTRDQENEESNILRAKAVARLSSIVLAVDAIGHN